MTPGYSGTPLSKRLGIRAVALPLGLVDVKVCAATDFWSCLKLVVRMELR
jgi:hypothetical protein